MQNNLSTKNSPDSLSRDGQETVTLSRQELNSVINEAVNEAVNAAMIEFQNLFIEVMGKKPAKGNQWLNTAAAAAILGKKPDRLRRMVKDGRLRFRYEVRDDRPRGANNPVYMFNILACQQRLMTPPEKRGK
jgi:hypothetical protein